MGRKILWRVKSWLCKEGGSLTEYKGGEGRMKCVILFHSLPVRGNH